jgi:Xaa-Pro dipeptidase
MNSEEKINDVQQVLKDQELDGWLLYDFRRSNELACQFLGIGKDKLLTRRFFYWIPQKGIPLKIVHRIEDKTLEHLPGDILRYSTWQELEDHLAKFLRGKSKILMEYSPRNALPYVSKVDAGTMDVVRGFGVEVVSSANLLQRYTSVWDENKFKLHLDAAEVLSTVADQTWGFIRSGLKQGKFISEYAVQQFMLERFTYHGCETSDAPICAVNAHSADPHYAPSSDSSMQIQPGDFVLIDLWCKKKRPEAVYADITRVGVVADKPTEKQQEIFEIVRMAQKLATDLVRASLTESKPLMGWEVDQVCRDYIQSRGYGPYFIHRTGHNIDTTDHGNGAHIDNYETHDDRLLLPGTCFSIEPGIYLPGEFGIRLEYDIVIHLDGQVQVTGGEQNEIVCLE